MFGMFGKRKTNVAPERSVAPVRTVGEPNQAGEKIADLKGKIANSLQQRKQLLAEASNPQQRVEYLTEMVRKRLQQDADGGAGHTVIRNWMSED